VLGERAVDGVRRQRAEAGLVERVVLPTELVPGASTAPPRG
jgi:hypothetical protein